MNKNVYSLYLRNEPPDKVEILHAGRDVPCTQTLQISGRSAQWNISSVAVIQFSKSRFDTVEIDYNCPLGVSTAMKLGKQGAMY